MLYAKRYRMQRKVAYSIITQYTEVTISGEVELVTGYGGQKAAKLMAGNDTLTFSRVAVNILDTTAESLGFTMAFNIKFLAKCSSGPILSTMMDHDSSGVSMYLCNDKLWVSLRDKEKMWSVHRDIPQMNE